MKTEIVAFECTGKDSRSAGFRLGLDTLVLARVAFPEATGRLEGRHRRS